VKLTTLLHLVPRLRMYAAIPPLRHTLSVCGHQGSLLLLQPGRELNLGPLEYDAGVLTIQSERSGQIAGIFQAMCIQILR